jgi:outer membrane protein TolC
MLETESSRLKWRAERGIFEPQLDSSITREANRRTNNILQEASQAGNMLFDERNTIVDSGIDSLIPSGGKIRVGYTESDLVNNVNPFGNIITTGSAFYTRQYQTFAGVSLTQPLLKNGGFTPTLVSMRVAALDSDIAFEQYRRQLMLTVSRAETAYWNFYFTQEQLRFFDDSVSVAQRVLEDSREKLKAGQGSELDVMQAQSDLALGQTKRNESQQDYYDAAQTMKTLAGTWPAPNLAGPTTEPRVHAADVPPQTNALISYTEGFSMATQLNPDYRIQQQKIKQEKLRLGYAKNQLLPELDLKTAYGFNGLGVTPGDSWAMAQTGNFPSWSVDLELIVPLGGNIKARNLLKAERVNLTEAYMNLHGVLSEIGNNLFIAIQKAQTCSNSIQSYQMVVHYNEELIKTELERLKAGTIGGHKVLEAEADLLEARQELAKALVQYRRTLTEVELADGSLLKSRNLETTRDELRRRAATLTRVSHRSGAGF